MSRFISVVIPTYNSARYLADSIDSVLNQTLTPLEVIVVDDGSTDETSHVVRRYQDRGPIRYFYQDNSGPSTARNRGIAESRGDLIAFLDADDIWAPISSKCN